MPADFGATLATWVQASLAIFKPGGLFVMIHRPEALGVSWPASEAGSGELRSCRFIRTMGAARIACSSQA